MTPELQAAVDRLMGLHMVAAHKYHLSQEFGTDAADEEAEVEAAALRTAIEELAQQAAEAAAMRAQLRHLVDDLTQCARILTTLTVDMSGLVLA